MTPQGCHCEERSDEADEAISGRRSAPVIIVHSLAHAVAALGAAAEAERPITLASAPDAGIYTGPGWFGALIAAAREAVPAAQCTALLDCSDDAGAAQAAIRAGIEGVIFTSRADVAERLADIASQRGVRLLTARPVPALDLGGLFFASDEALHRRCADILVGWVERSETHHSGNPPRQ